MSLLEEVESLRIPFDDIKEATQNFTTLIGKGGYGLVYKGQLLLSGKLTTVAVKKLQVSLTGQGLKEFLTEIQLLTRYKHPNLISLVGFCDEGEEKILIYVYAEHGSLDKYLTTPENRRKLTWKRRLDICVNAAHGLNYLHNLAAVNERVIHRDIKSANVLLDQNWKAMISDFGLSKLGRANENVTYLITNACGTDGYCDPEYKKTGILTKESDVYSFGVVLFEVLCGRLSFINVHNEHRFLPQLAQSHYKKGQISEIMDPELHNQLDSDSLKKFSEIAFKCIHNTRKQRPSMRWVLKKLQEIKMEINPLSLSLSPQQLLLAQQNMTSNDENKRLRMLHINNRSMSMGKDDGLSSSVGDIPNVGSPMGVLPRGDPDMLLKLKMAQLLQQQQLQQFRNQQQQQIHHSFSAPPHQNSNLNLQQEKIVGAISVGDGSMSNSFRENDQAGRKRKQPVGDGSLDGNFESLLSHDDRDMRDTVGHRMDVSKGFTFTEVNSVCASASKVVCCHFSSDGKLLASGGHDTKVVLWYTDSLKPKTTLEEHTSMITDVRFSSSMPRLATSSFDKTVRVWDADNPGFSLRTFLGHSAAVMSLDFHPNKDDLVCSCDGDGEIRYWSVSNGSCARLFKGATAQVRFQPRHGRFLAAAAENIVSILDVETQAFLYALPGHEKPINSVCWDPSGDYLASVSDESVRVWSLTAGNEGECVHDLGCYTNKFQSCVFHPSYASLLVIGCYQSLELWNMSLNKTMTLPAHEGLIAATALSTSTGLIASASHDKIVKLWK